MAKKMNFAPYETFFLAERGKEGGTYYIQVYFRA
jgi:hypothetical protein